MLIACVLSLAVSHASFAQPLEERLDEERFLRGLSEYRLPEVLEQYMAEHPPGDAVAATLYDITARRMMLSDPARTTAQEIAIVEDILAIRAKLIEGHPLDPRLAVWQADQATDLYFALYPIEQTGLTIEFGLPSPVQRQRGRRVAREMDRLADEAELGISETILNLESEPDYADDIALQLQRLRLARDERDRRIPFLRGVGAYLHAELNLTDPHEKRARYRIAVDTLEPLAPQLEGFLRTRAQLYAALAHARLGDLDRADELLHAVESDDAGAPADVFAARIGIAMNRAVRGDVPVALKELDDIEAHYNRLDDVFFRVLIADRRFLFRRELAEQATGAQRDRLLAEAFATYTDLLDADLGVGGETMRAIVFRKLANAAGGDVPLSELPAIVTIARAQNLARDEATVAEAIDLFRSSLARIDLDGQSKAAALFGLARAHHTAGDWLEAAKQFEKVARQYPLDPQSNRAIEVAAALLVRLRENEPGSEEIEQQLEGTLLILLERYPNLPTVERWRYEMGRLYFDRRAFARAKSALLAVPRGADVWPDCRFMLARITRAEARSARNPQVRRAEMEKLIAELARQRDALRSAAESIADGARRDIIAVYLDTLDVFEAEALLELGRPRDALARLEHEASGAALDRGLLGQVLAVRIKSFQALGDADAARREIGQLVSEMPDQVGAVVPAIVRNLTDDVQNLLARNRTDEARAMARTELLPLARVLEDWMREAALTSDQAAPLRLDLADAYRLAESFDRGLRLYEQVLAVRPDGLQATFGRAECLFGLERYEEAIKPFKRIAALRAEDHDFYFWQAELRTLQILDRVDRNTRQIVPRIRLLRAIDGDFGGLRREFDILQVKYTG